MRLTDKDVPLELARLYGTLYPTMDDLRKTFRNTWPPECYIPISAGTETLRSVYPDLTRQQIANIAAELTGLYIWRQTKIVYQFDDDLTAVLAEQARNMTGEEKLPIGILLHLPYHCIYIKSGYFREAYHMDGFLTWIEWDTNRKEFELRWQLIAESMQLSLPFTLHLSKPSLNECIDETALETKRWEWMRPKSESHAPKLHIVPDNPPPEPLQLALQMTLYLLADNHDEEPDRQQRAIYRKTKPRKNSRVRPDVPSSVQLNHVGVRVGAALRKSQSAPTSETAGTGTKKQTHLRRGHWHHYWTGAHNSPDRKLILKWTAPTIINPPEDEPHEPDIVVFPVKK